MALVDIDELKSVLGIGNIYPDATVQQVADAASNIIWNYLTFHLVGVSHVELTSNVAKFTTTSPHEFVVGESLLIGKCGSTIDGTRTVTTVPNAYEFTASITTSNITKRALIPNGEALLASQLDIYDAEPEVREAALAVACDIWITRTGTLGQQGVDFQSPAPYRLGRSMVTRVSGLLAKHLDTRTFIG